VWLAVVLGAVAGHAWLTLAPGPARGADATAVEASAAGDAEIREIVDLPRIDLALLADAGVVRGNVHDQNRNGGS
jgi:hypothetical protein